MMLKKVIWSIKMINRCLFTYLQIHSDKKYIIDDFLGNNKEIVASQIIKDKPLPFVNGKLAPAEYFYSLFTIEELASDNFKPKVFLVIDESLGGKSIKIGNMDIVLFKYIQVK